ncbi:hypothetical protein [Frankia sp. CiP3]|uniref:hypothetical protein n=1 Tax=Frankia sp. CiP3 TaxID=2880971 RepID=UPI001EF4C173|nr:hypothetical protein [Frankia sp. CiP3]
MTARKSDEARRLFVMAADIRRVLYRREPDRVDLVEELAVALGLLGDACSENDVRSEIAGEIRSFLVSFEERGVLTQKGRAVLDWIRDW